MNSKKIMVSEKLFMVIQEPYISEKSTIMADKFKQFTFKVLKSASKIEIKEAVENLFAVKVAYVSVLNVKGKIKQFRQKLGKRKDWKKAYVILHEGYDINFANIE